MPPFHKDALSLAGGLTAPAVQGSSVGGRSIQGSGKRAPNTCQQFPPKTLGNMLGIRNPTPPNSDSDSGSAGSDKSNRHAVLQDNHEEEVSDATTDILPIGEIPESIQEGTVLTQPYSNDVPDNIQVEVTKPEVEGGTAPREEDPQPDGVASSKDADFIKAESEQDLPSIRRPTIHLKTQKGSSGYQILPKWISRRYLRTQRISIPMTSWSATPAELLQMSPRRIGNPNVDLTRHMPPSMPSSKAKEVHW